MRETGSRGSGESGEGKAASMPSGAAGGGAAPRGTGRRPGADPKRVVALLADDAVLRAYAALVLGAHRTSDIARTGGLGIAETARCLVRLEAGGLVEREAAGWRRVPDALRRIARGTAWSTAPAAEHDERDAAVLRRFLVGGRLVGLPADREKRMTVLDHVARLFEPGVRYTEDDARDLLLQLHDEHEELRRHLIDAGFLSTSEGVYWRTGGTFDV